MAAIGYKVITKHGHPNAYANGQIQEHIFIMSEMLGRPLTAIEVVHHVDEDKGNNTPSNLQLFATQAAHLRHHAKMDALKASGNALFKKCPYCKKYDTPLSMLVRKDGTSYHKECSAQYNALRRNNPTLKAKDIAARAATRATPEGKAKDRAANAKSRAKRKLSQQSI